MNHLTKNNLDIELYDLTGRLLQKTVLFQGSTIVNFDTRTLYEGNYLIKIIDNGNVVTKKITISK